jgi:hypothetical protein
MRITIALDQDVAARIERLKKTKPFNQLMNDLLRAGLDEIEGASATTRMPYSITPVEGMPRRTDLDKVAEVLAEIEGDDFR